MVDPATEELRQYTYEQITVPESYSGPRLSFPLSVTDTNTLLSAFKEQQVQHTAILTKWPPVKDPGLEFRISERDSQTHFGCDIS